ncbi:MAG: DUF362 domain-containing protein [Deltaproteobacteria bacterium]|nr:DUF362 domain-containing protein [Deltaproteobacteria bacterium]
MSEEKVSIVRCKTYKEELVSESLVKLLAPLGGIQTFINRGDKVLLKPNLLKAALPEKAITTHPALVEAVAREVQAAGGIVSIGDSPGIGKMDNVFEETGMTGVSLKTGAKLVEFKDSLDKKTCKGSNFKSLEISKDVMEADKIINLPKVKTHAQMYVTLGVKNCFGCIVGKRKPQWHYKAGVSREHFANLLLDIYNMVAPVLTIADGITAMEGNGPGSGDPRSVGLLFASSNAIAMDRVITEVLGLSQKEVPLFHAAIKRGFVSPHAGDTRIFGPAISELKISNFSPPEIIDLMFGPPFIRRYLKSAMTARPKVDHESCTLCMDCIKTCPVQVMSVKEKKIDILHDECINCFCCQEICPQGAITPRQGWLLKILRKKG